VKRFSLTALFLAVAFFVSSASPAFAVGNGSLPDPRSLALVVVALTLLLVSKFRPGGGGSF
jgi:hypothetical protein